MRKRGLSIFAACVAFAWSAAAWAATVAITGQNEQGQPVAGQSLQVETVPNEEVSKPRKEQHPVARTTVTTTETGTANVPVDDQKIDINKYTAVFYFTRDHVTYTAMRPLSSLNNGVPLTFVPVGQPTATTALEHYWTPALRARLPSGSPFAGPNLSVFVSGNRGTRTLNEYMRPSGVQTSKLDDSRTSFGGGVTGTYNVMLAPNLSLGPFVTLNVSDNEIVRTFGGPSSIATRTVWSVAAGPQIGFPFKIDQTSGLVTFQVGVSAADQELRVHFLGMPSSVDHRLAVGGMAGLGIFLTRPDFKIGNLPFALTGQIVMTVYGPSTYNAPLGSLGFNYQSNLTTGTGMVGIDFLLGQQ